MIWVWTLMFEGKHSLLTVAIDIKCPENMLCELGCVAIGEKVSIYLLELLDSKLARWTVLTKTFVPFGNFCWTKLGLGGEIVKHLWLQLAVLFAHSFASKEHWWQSTTLSRVFNDQQFLITLYSLSKRNLKQCSIELVGFLFQFYEILHSLILSLYLFIVIL